MAKGFFDEELSESFGPCQYIKGVVCRVQSCKYHDASDHCTAPTVHIGPSYAAHCTDTACATFAANATRTC